MHVEGKVVRPIGLDTFVDITGPDVKLVAVARTFVEFDADLTPEQVAAVFARMESRDDADRAKRADLRADRDALAADDPLRRLYDYTLGD